MSWTDAPCQPAVGTEAPALAGAPALPSLKKDNCTGKHRAKAVFVAQENHGSRDGESEHFAKALLCRLLRVAV